MGLRVPYYAARGARELLQDVASIRGLNTWNRAWGYYDTIVMI